MKNNLFQLLKSHKFSLQVRKEIWIIILSENLWHRKVWVKKNYEFTEMLTQMQNGSMCPVFCLEIVEQRKIINTFAAIVKTHWISSLLHKKVHKKKLGTYFTEKCKTNIWVNF